MLERHDNAHLKETPAAKRSFQKPKKQSCSSIATSPLKCCDFFDAGIMERLQHRLLLSSHFDENGFPVSNGEVTLTSQVIDLTVLKSTINLITGYNFLQIIGKRFDEHGCLTFLLRWTPPDL